MRGFHRQVLLVPGGKYSYGCCRSASNPADAIPLLLDYNFLGERTAEVGNRNRNRVVSSDCIYNLWSGWATLWRLPENPSISFVQKLTDCQILRFLNGSYATSGPVVLAACFNLWGQPLWKVFGSPSTKSSQLKWTPVVSAQEGEWGVMALCLLDWTRNSYASPTCSSLDLTRLPWK